MAKGLKEAFIMFQSILDKYVSVAPEDSFDQLMSSGEDKKNIKSQIFSKTSYLAMLLIIATLIEVENLLESDCGTRPCSLEVNYALGGGGGKR